MSMIGWQIRIVRRTLTATTLAACLLHPAAAKSRLADLAHWTETELIPYVETQLTEHPRYKGETVVFVALADGAPSPVTNELVLAIRDRLVTAIIDKPGISIGWQPEYDFKDRIDCARDSAHYFIGFETAQLIDRRYRVTMRVLDVEDQSWVTGSGMIWEGRLTSAQRRAFEQTLIDEYFRGGRDAPFEASQTDVLAARLAHDLSCSLVRQVAGEYVIAKTATAARTHLPGTIELVWNNLAGNPSLRIATDKSDANAILEGKAHHIDGDLYQYWVTVTATGGTTQLPAAGASAYVRLPVSAAAERNPPARIATHAPAAASRAGGELLAPIRLLEPRQRRACYRGGSSHWQEPLVDADYTVGRGECILLQMHADRDAVVFLLNYQVRHGLVRLSDSRCGREPMSFRLSAGERLRFPNADDGRPSASAWTGQQGVESFYALAVSDPSLAREIGGLIGRLPKRCTLSASDGLKGAQLGDWLDDLDAIVDQGRHAVDWQAVRIQHVL
jgi:hypothetical protein